MKAKTYITRRSSLDVELSSRKAIVTMVDPSAETRTGGVAIRIKVRNCRRYRRTARSIRSPAPKGASASSFEMGFIYGEMIDVYVAVYLRKEANLFAVGIDERFLIRHPEKNEARAKAVLPRRNVLFKEELLAVGAL